MARLLDGDSLVEEIPLAFAGVSSTFAGRLHLGRSGEFRLQVLALDAANANFGQVQGQLTVTP